MFLLRQAQTKLKKHKTGRVAINVAKEIVDIGQIVLNKEPKKKITRTNSNRAKQPYIVVYHIRFKDGAEYVGQTKCSIKKRMWYHLHKPCNKGVYSRLRNGMPYEVKVISKHTNGSRANQAEINLIWERKQNKYCKTLLNRRGDDIMPAPDFSH